MRTLYALVAVCVIWNGGRASGFDPEAPTAAVDRPRAAEPSKGGVLLAEPSARITIHGRLQFIGSCLPGETGLWLMQAGDQSHHLNFVNDELTKKATGLGTQPVTVHGYLRKGQVVVESLGPDGRADAAPGVQVHLQAKLNFPETLRPEDKGLSMTIDGQLFWLHASPELMKKAEDLADAVVVVSGTLELEGRSFIVKVTHLHLAIMR